MDGGMEKEKKFAPRGYARCLKVHFLSVGLRCFVEEPNVKCTRTSVETDNLRFRARNIASGCEAKEEDLKMNGVLMRSINCTAFVVFGSSKKMQDLPVGHSIPGYPMNSITEIHAHSV